MVTKGSRVSTRQILLPWQRHFYTSLDPVSQEADNVGEAGPPDREPTGTVLRL